MSTKNVKEGQISVRATLEEIAFWNQAWKPLGYRSRSEMARAGMNSKASPGTPSPNPKSKEEIAHLSRIGTTLMDVRTLIIANDNIQDDPDLEDLLYEAIHHVLELKKG